MSTSQYIGSPVNLLESSYQRSKYPLKKSKTYNYEPIKRASKVQKKVIKYSLKQVNSSANQIRERKNHMRSVEIVTRVKKPSKTVYKNDFIQKWPSWNNKSQTCKIESSNIKIIFNK